MSVVPNINKLEANRARLSTQAAKEGAKLDEMSSRKRNLEYTLRQPESGFFAKRKAVGELKTLNKNIAATKLRANSLNRQGMAAKKLINNARAANRRARGALIPGNNGYNAAEARRNGNNGYNAAAARRKANAAALGRKVINAEARRAAEARREAAQRKANNEAAARRKANNAEARRKANNAAAKAWKMAHPNADPVTEAYALYR